MRLSVPEARRILRAASRDPDRVILTKHAQVRMLRRRIAATEAVECLAMGVITEGPAQDVHGKWVCTVERAALDRRIKVVAAIDEVDPPVIIIITVM